MKSFYLFFCLSIACLSGLAQEVTIIPQFAVGDTIRYCCTTQVVMHHGKDWMTTTTKMLPTLVVDSRNDDGFVVTTSTKLDSMENKSSNPEAANAMSTFGQTDSMNDYIGAMVLRIQLGADFHPVAVLNIDEVKRQAADAMVNIIAKQQDIDIENNAEWKMDTKPLIEGAVKYMCTPAHLIEEQFGYIPYFEFLGIPLRSGKIAASKVFPGEFQRMFPQGAELDMIVSQSEESSEMNRIFISGEAEKWKVEATLLFARGILKDGRLSINEADENSRMELNYILERLPHK